MQPCDSRRSSPLPSPPHTRPAAIGGSRRVTVRSELLRPLMPCRSSFCVLAQLCRICPSADHCASSSSEAVCVIAYFWVRLSIREIAKLVARHIAQRRLRLRPKLLHGNLPEIQWPEEDCDFSHCDLHESRVGGAESGPRDRRKGSLVAEATGNRGMGERRQR